MEAKELKKLSRSELLEMLLDRSKEVEHLRKELDETKKHIATLEREVEKSGDINAAIQKLNSATEQIQNLHLLFHWHLIIWQIENNEK